ncbi:MAG: amidohydrolase family protein [Caldilineaceae bacterium]|nr:amidohydrolase family protein [Caldilineaceae bacterium]
MIIDAHMHYADDDPDFLALLAEYNLKFLNICFVKDPQVDWRDQASLYQVMASQHPDRFAWCTSFTLPDLTNPDFVSATWQDEAIAALDADFANGAIACKVWKNVGMEVRNADGSFLMPDDPIFDPIYEHVAARNRTLLTHIAEPIACWQPLVGDNPHMGYYRDNPQWHMYNRPEYPSHAQLITARDNLIAKHPTLRVVGAHLGSLEYDVDEVAARLDKYPNFAVDISARLIDLAIQPTAKVRNFFMRYPDRILFGTDVVMRQRPSAMSPEERNAALSRLRAGYETHFAFFDRGQEMTVRDRATTGLALPPAILDQFYVESARAWYPGL